MGDIGREETGGEGSELNGKGEGWRHRREVLHLVPPIQKVHTIS